jgi:hypothetical protein
LFVVERRGAYDDERVTVRPAIADRFGHDE